VDRAAAAVGGEERVPTIWELCCEVFRLELMRRLEAMLAQAGFRAVAGVDEAGRGCLAGPVVAAAVIPDPHHAIPGVDDSKKLPPEARARLAEEIRASAVAWAVAEVDAPTIDRINILRASRLAMREALAALTRRPDCVVTDAMTLPGLGVPCLPVVKGDAWSYSVACASIVAKVARDRTMTQLDRDYPHYGFARHKGYGAPGHLDALARFGPSPLHRLTFGSVVPRLAELEA
jgi:ribonuclease HII